MINSKDETSHLEIDVLTDADLDAISGGSIFGDIERIIVHALEGHSDQRRPTK